MPSGDNRRSSKIIEICLMFFICVGGVSSAACQSKPTDAASILKPCQELIDKDDLIAASKCYQNTLITNPQQADAVEETFTKTFFEKCLNLKAKENYKQAIVCLEGLSVLKPNSANVQFQLARSYYEYNKTKRNNDFELLGRAEEAIKTYLKIKPEDAAAYYVYGRILSQKSDWREAVEKHQEAVKLEPKNSFYWLELAITQEKADDFSAALANYYQVLLLDPNNTLALYYSATLYEKTGNTDKAIENFEKLLRIEEKFDDASERLENLKKQKIQPKQKTKTQSVASDGTHTLPY